MSHEKQHEVRGLLSPFEYPLYMIKHKGTLRGPHFCRGRILEGFWNGLFRGKAFFVNGMCFYSILLCAQSS